jgi:outer membrane lipoprotein carrier protein
MSLLPLVLVVAAAPAAPAAKPAAPVAPAPDPAVAAVVLRMQKQYDQMQDLKARFQQETTNAATGRKKTATGQVQLKKPGRLRMDYETPDKQLYVSNGQQFWYWVPAEKTAYKNDPRNAQLPAAFAFLMGKGKLGDEFVVSAAKELPYGAAGDHKLSLKPRQPQTTYKNIYFVVDPKTDLVKQTILIDAAGNVNAIAFLDVKVNGKLADAAFKWTPPGDAKITDLAKAGAGGPGGGAGASPGAGPGGALPKSPAPKK